MVPLNKAADDFEDSGGLQRSAIISSLTKLYQGIPFESYHFTDAISERFSEYAGRKGV